MNNRKTEETARKFQLEKNSKDLFSKRKLKMAVVKVKMFERKIQNEQACVDLMFLQSKVLFKLTLRKRAVIHKKSSAESLNAGCKDLFEKMLRLL